jgi:hypothetical protein
MSDHRPVVSRHARCMSPKRACFRRELPMPATKRAKPDQRHLYAVCLQLLRKFCYGRLDKWAAHCGRTQRGIAGLSIESVIFHFLAYRWRFLERNCSDKRAGQRHPVSQPYFARWALYRFSLHAIGSREPDARLKLRRDDRRQRLRAAALHRGRSKRSNGHCGHRIE